MIIKKKILIIDDEPDIREYLTLEINDYYRNVDIFEANDGSQGLSKAQNQKFDVVITDLRMPNLSGASVVKHLSRLPAKLIPDKIVIFSGFIDDTTKELVKPNLNISFLAKPVNIDMLIQYLDESLIKNKIKLNKQRMDVQFINPFIDGVIDVFGSHCGTIPELEEKGIRQFEDIIGSDISSLVEMKSDLFMGSMAIGFKNETYKNLYRSITNEKIDLIDKDNCCTAGEICNQIFNYAKSKLNQRGFNIEMNTPTINIENQKTIKHFVKGPCLSLKFTSSLGPFFLEVAVSSHQS